VKCLSANHKLTRVGWNPGSKYEKYVTKAQAFLAVNKLLDAAQTVSSVVSIGRSLSSATLRQISACCVLES
jgi:hypothetical protein